MKDINKKIPKWVRIVLPAALIVVWVAVAGIGGPYFGKISEISSTDLTTFLPKSAESTKVNSQLSKFSDTNSIPALAVFSHGNKVLSNSEKADIAAVSKNLGQVKGVEGAVSPPIISDDGEAAFVSMPLKSDGDFKTIFPALKKKLDGANLSADYKLTGPASLAHDLQGVFSGIDSALLFVALAVVFVILLIVYRSPFLPLIVLATSMAALSAAILIVYYLAKSNSVQLNGQVQGILSILVIGAATDYSLLYIARFREELSHYNKTWQASLAALKASFEPILAAGLTVIIGLMCLLLSDLGSNKALGPVGGVGIASSILAALTFLPAMLLVLGQFVFWPRKPRYEANKTQQSYTKQHPVWTKVSALVRKHPRRLWIGCSALLLLAACIGVPQLKAEGVTQSNLILGYSEARAGQKVLDAHFASGSGSPTYVLAHAAKQKQVVAALEGSENVESINVTAIHSKSGVLPVGKTAVKLQQEILSKMVKQQGHQARLSAKAMGQEVFSNAAPKVIKGKVLLQVTLKDPADSLKSRQTIVALREAVKKVDGGALVGGESAIQYDTNQAALRDERLLIPLILVAITIILMLLLRAIVAPILLLLTTVLSFGATIGIAAMLFNHVWKFPGADPSVVIFGFVFLVALGIDYNIFLMTRVREETIKLGVNAGTIKALVVTGGVITSAGIVLASTFASLSVIPILFLVQIAFIVAFGVLLDTIVVRSLLVPALTLEVGRWMWWPSQLAKKLRKSQ